MFTLSIHGEHDIFHFPAPIPLELRLKDVLEEEVDDKYVLSDTAIQGLLKHNETTKQRVQVFFGFRKIQILMGGVRQLS